jgi:hypothetical protein
MDVMDRSGVSDHEGSRKGHPPSWTCGSLV